MMRGIISAGGQRLSRDYRRRLQKKVWLTNKATWPGRPPMACDPRFTVALIFTAWFSTNLTINFYNK